MLQFRVGLGGGQGGGGAEVTVLANEPVNFMVLAELLQAGGQNDEFARVGHGHARAINGLVAQPGALEFGRVEIDHDLFQRLVEHLKIHLQGQRGGLFKAGGVIAHKQATHGEPAVFAPANHRVNIDDGEMLGEVFGGVIQDAADRRVRPAHHAFHAIGRADVMALVDAFHAAGAYKDVLVVVGHADDFMRHHLADGENEVVPAGGNEIRHLRRPGKLDGTTGNFAHKRGRHFADRGDASAPVMNAEQTLGHTGEHFRNLRTGHRRVRAQRGQDIHQLLAIKLVREGGEFPGMRMKAGEVRGHHEHAMARAEPFERFKQAGPQSRVVQFIRGGTAFEIQHNSAFSVECGRNRPWQTL